MTRAFVCVLGDDSTFGKSRMVCTQASRLVGEDGVGVCDMNPSHLLSTLLPLLIFLLSILRLL